MNTTRSHKADNSITKLLHSLIAHTQGGFKVYQAYQLECARAGAKQISYDVFTAKLRGDGHSTLGIDELPLLCNALHLTGIDTSPIAALISQLCLPDITYSLNGNLTDELVDLLNHAGNIARRSQRDGLTELPQSELHRLRALCGQIHAITNRMDKECRNALVA